MIIYLYVKNGSNDAMQLAMAVRPLSHTYTDVKIATQTQTHTHFSTFQCDHVSTDNDNNSINRAIHSAVAVAVVKM